MSSEPSALADRLAIDDQITRYCRAIDTGDWDLLDTIFTPDAVLDYVSSGGMRGAFPEVKAWLAGVLPFFAMRQHIVTNREITVTGDTATSRSSLYNPMGRTRADGGLDLFFTGATYHDRWRRTAGGWRITERTLVEHWRMSAPQ
ncbi:MAG TPA: nuclear transport factor 2 family protein [Candidatus Eisenbacteria bacterium]|nr:nuclear transport factor 2 family protein [Candidatus Eisenbacteria bacterium]